MDRHLAMVRATGLRSVRVGSGVGVGLLATGDCDGIVTVGLFFVCSFVSDNFVHDFPTFWQSDLVRYNTFVEEQF